MVNEKPDGSARRGAASPDPGADHRHRQASSPGSAAGSRPLALAARDAWRLLPELLGYEIAFRAIAFLVLTPLVVWLFERFIAASGSAAIGNFDIARFLLTPLGLAMSAVIVASSGTILIARFAGLTYLGLRGVQGHHVTYARTLRHVLARLPRLMQISLVVLLLLAVVALPFVVGIALTAWLLLSGHDINYYLHVQPPEFLWAAGIAVALLVGALIAVVTASVPLLFAVPLALTTADPVLPVLRESRRLARGRFRAIAMTLLRWLSAAVGAWLAANALLYVAGWLLVTLSGERAAALIVSLGGIAAVSILANFVLDFGASAVLSLLVARLYWAATDNADTSPTPPQVASPPLGKGPRWDLVKKAPLGFVLAGLVLAAGVAHQLLEGIQIRDRVDVTAHRGASLAAPENSLSAVRQAIADGATYVEFDVQRTADGVIVVCHDEDLMRVAGSPLVVNRSTLDELRQADIGRSFSDAFAGEQLPTLEEVIDAAEGRIKLVVELKSYKDDAPRLVADVVRILRKRQTGDNAVIMSLKYDEVLEVKRIAPGDHHRLRCIGNARRHFTARGRLLRRVAEVGNGCPYRLRARERQAGLRLDRG